MIDRKKFPDDVGNVLEIYKLIAHHLQVDTVTAAILTLACAREKKPQTQKRQARSN